MLEGFSILNDIEKIYSIMGVCPQHDLLWPTLTAREHLAFYGVLKNLKGCVCMCVCVCVCVCVGLLSVCQFSWLPRIVEKGTVHSS